MNRLAKGLSLWLALPVAVLCAALTAAGAWLLATEAGTRWLVETALAKALPGARVERIAGTLSRGLDVTALILPLEDGEIRIAAVHGAWNLWSLLGGQFTVAELRAEGVDVHLGTAVEDVTEPPSPWPSLRLPLPVTLGKVLVSDLRIHRGEQEPLVVSHVQLRGVLNPLQLHIHSLELTSPLGSATLAGRIATGFPYALKLKGDWQVAADDGAWQGSLNLNGPITGLDLNHQLQAPFTIASQGRVGVNNTSRGMDFDPRLLVFNLVNSWDNLDLARYDLELVSTGNLSLAGSLASYQLAGEAHLDATAPAPGGDLPLPSQRELLQRQALPAALALAAEGTLEDIAIAALTLRTANGDATASGTIQWLEGIRWDLALLAQDLNTSALLPQWPALLSADLASTGSWRDGVLAATIAIRELSGTVNDLPLTGAGTLALADGAIASDDLRLAVGDNSLAVHGRLAETWALEWDLQGNHLADLGLGLAGKLTSSGRFSGTPTAPVISATAASPGLAYGAWRLGALTLAAEVTATEAIRLNLALTNLQGPGLPVGDLNLTASGSLANHQVTASYGAEAVQLGVSARGGYRDHSWTGVLADLNVDSPYSSSWHQRDTATLALGAEDASLGNLCLARGQGLVCARGEYANGQWSASASLAELGLDELQSWLPPGTTLAGTLGGNLDVSGGAGKPQGNYQLTTTGGEFAYGGTGEEPLRQPLALSSRGSVTGTALSTRSDLSLRDTANLTLSLDASLEGSGPLSGRLTGQIDSLVWLQAFTTAVMDPEGRVEADFAVAGTVAAPQLSGQLTMSGLAATLPAAGIRLEQGGGTLKVADDGNWLLEGELVSGSGTLAVVGSGNLATALATPLILDLKGDNLTLVNLPDTLVIGSPDVRLTLADQVVSLTGQVAVPEARIILRQLPAGAVGVSPDEVVNPPLAAPARIALRVATDIQLVLGNEVKIEGFGLATELRGRLRLTSKNSTLPSARGNISLHNGTYEAYGQALKVTQGNLIFQGPIDNPGLNITAARETPTATVGVRIGGTARNISSEVFSNPALPPTDALIVLVTGKPPADISQSEANQVMNAATALGIGQSDWITSRLQSAFGMDVLTLASGDSYEESTLVVGKYLTPKLFVSYIQNLFSPQGSVALDYQLSKKFGLKAESGETQSIDLLYKVEHKGLLGL